MSRYGTMENKQATRDETGQRARFKRRNDGKGASRDLSSIFTNTDNPISLSSLNADTSSFDKTKSAIISLYNPFPGGGVEKGENPDFADGHTGSQFRYSGSESMLDDVTNQDDAPSTKSPNVKTLEIGDNGLPLVQEGSEETLLDLQMNGGFGADFERNDEQNVNRVRKHYIKRKIDNEVTLGEYIDIANYLSDLD